MCLAKENGISGIGKPQYTCERYKSLSIRATITIAIVAVEKKVIPSPATSGRL
jgi:hypothetical protein